MKNTYIVNEQVWVSVPKLDTMRKELNGNSRKEKHNNLNGMNSNSETAEKSGTLKTDQ